MRHFLREFGADLLALLLVVASLLALFLVASLAAGQEPAAAAPCPPGKVHTSAVGNRRVGKVWVTATVTRTPGGLYHYRYLFEYRGPLPAVRLLWDSPLAPDGRDFCDLRDRRPEQFDHLSDRPPVLRGQYVELVVEDTAHRGQAVRAWNGAVRAWQKVPVPSR